MDSITFVKLSKVRNDLFLVVEKNTEEAFSSGLYDILLDLDILMSSEIMEPYQKDNLTDRLKDMKNEQS